MSQNESFTETLSARLDTVARFGVRYAGAFLVFGIGLYVLAGFFPLLVLPEHPAMVAGVYRACSRVW